jgi:hypothetical protein
VVTLDAADLERRFAAQGLRRAGILLFPPDIALELISEARTFKVPVLGIDGFWLSDQATQPSMEDSVDFSNQSVDSWDAAERFVRDRISSTIWLEVVLG